MTKEQRDELLTLLVDKCFYTVGKHARYSYVEEREVSAEVLEEVLSRIVDALPVDGPEMEGKTE